MAKLVLQKLSSASLTESYKLLSTLDYRKLKEDEWKQLRHFFPKIVTRTDTYVSTFEAINVNSARSMRRQCKILIKCLRKCEDNAYALKTADELQKLWQIVFPDAKFQWNFYKLGFFEKNEKQFFCVDVANPFFKKEYILNVSIISRKRKASGDSACIPSRQRTRSEALNLSMPLITYQNELRYFWKFFDKKSVITNRNFLIKLGQFLRFTDAQMDIELKKTDGFLILQERESEIETVFDTTGFEKKYYVSLTPYYRVCARRLDENLNIWVYYSVEINAFEKKEKPTPLILETSDSKSKRLIEEISKEKAFAISLNCKLSNVNNVVLKRKDEIKLCKLGELTKEIESDVNVILSKIDFTLNWLFEEMQESKETSTSWIVTNKNKKLSWKKRGTAENLRLLRSSLSNNRRRQHFQTFETTSLTSITITH